MAGNVKARQKPADACRGDRIRPRRSSIFAITILADPQGGGGSKHRQLRRSRARVRPLSVPLRRSGPTSSMMICCRRGRPCASAFGAENFCCRAISAFQALLFCPPQARHCRACSTRRPRPGSYLKQPTRSISASSSQSSRSAKIGNRSRREKPTMKVGAQGKLGTLLAPLILIRARVFSLGCRTASWPLGFPGFACWKREMSRYGQNLALRHQADDFIDVRVGIDILQPEPRRPKLAKAPSARFEKIWARELSRSLHGARPHISDRRHRLDVSCENDKQFFHAGTDKPLRLAPARPLA